MKNSCSGALLSTVLKRIELNQEDYTPLPQLQKNAATLHSMVRQHSTEVDTDIQICLFS